MMTQTKWIGAFLVPLLILFIYVWIPHQIKSQYKVIIPQNQTGVSRKLVQVEEWKKWMPFQNELVQQFSLPSGKLILTETYIASVKGFYIYQEDTAAITFMTENAGKDSTLLTIETILNNRHLSPFKRLSNYWQSIRIEDPMKKIAQAARQFYGTTKGVYGYPIVLEKVKDSVLMTTQKNFKDTPTIAQVYEMLNSLQQHIQKNMGTIKGDPMVNITNLGQENIFVQVGLPIEKSIPEANGFQIKKMVLGNILSAQVKGDNHTVYRAFKETENFVRDNSKESPAMPFIVYHTNRLIQKDSTQWVSTIYYPIY
jgi:hypothetical protein